LAPIARQQVPIALVLGLADTVVPPSENGLPLASEYQKLGGLVKTWHKPGQGHHPHGLHPADPLRRFLLSATGLTENPAALPISSVEYRGGAGWGANWHAAFEHLQQVVSSHPESNIVFLGDSITQGLTGHQNRVAQVGGKRPIDRYFGDRQALSLGLSGDRTEHILWRLQNGQLAGLSPEWLVVMVGVNNISAAGHTGKETADGTAAIVRWLRSHLPDSRIVLCGCFPAGNAPTDPRRAEVAELHQSIAHLAEDSSVEYVDLRSHFLKDDGTLNQNMSADAIHITRSGQAAWMKVLAGVLGSQ
jgi:lysophospholipase L1-like esterase